MPALKSVDVAIQVYGKPLMTGVAISSLLEHSGKWIDRIYLIEEKIQPNNSDFSYLSRHFKDRIIHVKPRFYMGLKASRKSLHWFTPYRRSIRYQYAFEKSKNPYLFTIHNDMLFHGDILEAYLAQMKSGHFAGVGPIGQCWNCPAFYAKKCTPDTYGDYKPDWKELGELSEQFYAPRKEIYQHFAANNQSWPLPECRLNEWAALIDLKQVRPYVRKLIFGQMDLDIATRWFSILNHKGLRFKNSSIDPYATHVWTGVEGEENSGLSTQNNINLYERAEMQSYQKLVNEYRFSEEELEATMSTKDALV
ncbi:hypothetical protein [Siphonobacter sp. SORGH_AS_1065]|uniref:hypothetical protein n=1 Tax=Siphonobacter sp. SORGH_AS_1065 TaxID=3041795 RepID=UPI00278715C7|nr:hypothetical protein [Siphonobacter sp. SORGH_AS_1065]MDQ1087361.1 hypothetical protein [Siphonobacter sp. SORGH_AS_1065]